MFFTIPKQKGSVCFARNEGSNSQGVTGYLTFLCGGWPSIFRGHLPFCRRCLRHSDQARSGRPRALLKRSQQKRLLVPLALRGHQRCYQKGCGTKFRFCPACGGFSQGRCACRRCVVGLGFDPASGFSAAGASTVVAASAVPTSACDSATIV